MTNRYQLPKKSSRKADDVKSKLTELLKAVDGVDALFPLIKAADNIVDCLKENNIEGDEVTRFASKVVPLLIAVDDLFARMGSLGYGSMQAVLVKSMLPLLKSAVRVPIATIVNKMN